MLDKEFKNKIIKESLKIEASYLKSLLKNNKKQNI